MTKQPPSSARLGPGSRSATTILAAAVLVGLLVGGVTVAVRTHDPPPSGTGGDHAGADAGREELIAESTVLEDESHGPQLCLGNVLDSLPPQCGGPDVVGWDWNAQSGFEHGAGTRWGDFVVVGTYDAAAHSFTMTRPAVSAGEYHGSDLPPAERAAPGWQTPCEPPAGGWQIIDPALTNQSSLEATMHAANARADYGGSWVDQSINPALSDKDTANDPSRLIINVAVTGNTDAAEADLRRTWGGALCVSQANHTEHQLRRIQHELSSQPGLLYSSDAQDSVEVGVVWDGGTLQARMDDQYGPGTVIVHSALHPVS